MKNLCFSMIFFVAEIASADTLICPYRYSVASENGKYLFIMEPKCDKDCDRNDGQGAVYNIIPGEQGESLWEVNGWYTFFTYISCDGKYLIRMNTVMNDVFDSPIDEEKLNEGLMAIAFYENGKLIKSYDVFDLDIETGASIQTIVWMNRGVRYKFSEPCGNIFELVAWDGTGLSFDITTGEIVKREPGKVIPPWKKSLEKKKKQNETFYGSIFRYLFDIKN